MILDDILTPRLRLVAFSTPLLQADFGGDLPRFASLLGAQIPACWPPENWEPHCFDWIQNMAAHHPHIHRWNRYILLREPHPILLGTVGAFPRTDTEAEIGYGILPPWRRQRYATEAARALIGALFSSAGTQTITAQTFPHLIGSVRVMERCGMQPAGPGDEPGTVRYRLQRTP